jgi:hypothetical protein
MSWENEYALILKTTPYYSIYRVLNISIRRTTERAVLVMAFMSFFLVHTLDIEPASLLNCVEDL